MNAAFVPLLALTLLAVAPACAGLRRSTAPLHLDAIAPDSVERSALGATWMVLRGTGFETDSAIGNTVIIGPSTIEHVQANADGTELRLTFPSSPRSSGEAPPRPVPAGNYDIVVRTGRGESNVRTLRVIP